MVRVVVVTTIYPSVERLPVLTVAFLTDRLLPNVVGKEKYLLCPSKILRLRRNRWVST